MVQERLGVIGWIGIHPDDRDVKWVSLAIVSMFLRYLLNKGVQNTLPILSCLGAHLLGIGVENLTLHTNYPSSTTFRASGYENITTNASYTGGVVRQFEGFSFSRIFEGSYSGSTLPPLHLSPVAIAIVLPPPLYVWKHLQLIFKLVSYTQPETTYQIFTRATFNLDVATGKVRTTPGSGYSSTGPSSSFGIKNILPPPPAPECSIWDVVGSCSTDQTEALMNRTAVIEDFIVVQPAT